jgi:hypothetical protein
LRLSGSGRQDDDVAVKRHGPVAPRGLGRRRDRDGSGGLGADAVVPDALRPRVDHVEPVDD